MGFIHSYSISTILVTIAIVASLLETSTCMANNNKDMMKNNGNNLEAEEWGRGRGSWSYGRRQPSWPAYNSTNCPFSHKNATATRPRGPNKIVVGGSNNWNFGFNYSDWALKNGPFYLNDVLVFKYAAPVNGSPGHSVYLLPDFWSYLKCDLSRAKQVATPTQGGGEGFEFKLNRWQPHYFACGEHNGIHCNLGMMKFFVMPIFRYWS